MKNLRNILNEKFSYLAIGIISIFLFLEYIQLSSVYDSHKTRALETAQILADYLEPTLLFESKQDFYAIADKLDFKKTYHGIALFKSNGELFAARGDRINRNDIDSSLFESRKLFVQAKVKQDDKVLGILYISFKIDELENDMITAVSIFVIVIIVLFFGFYVYIKQLNQIVISPVNQLIEVINQSDDTDYERLANVESQILEIDDLKENFSQLLVQINQSRKDLERLNKNLERKVEDKTKELSEALNETKKYQNKIIAQEKLASLGGLSAGIAHEIKNPLNLIINSSQLVAGKLEVLEKFIKKVEDPEVEIDIEEMKEEIEEINDICEIINSSGKRADRIIKGMLSQARSKSSKKERQNLTEVCKQGINLAYHSMRAQQDSIQIEVQENIQQDVFFVCYFEEIERAIINLIDNSFYALKEKKDADDSFKAKLLVTLKEETDRIEISVEDNGTGISEELLEKVKEPFFTTKPTGKGTGLGISMINDIVTSQGGEFIIESKLGEYTKMSMIFPILEKNKNIAS